MNQFDFYDDELKKKEEEEARLRNANSRLTERAEAITLPGRLPTATARRIIPTAATET